MVSGWRLAFCTTVKKHKHSKTTIATEEEEEEDGNVDYSNSNRVLPSPRLSSRFSSFFSSSSSSSTPRLPKLTTNLTTTTSNLRCRTASATAPVSQSSSVANSPKLQIKTTPPPPPPSTAAAKHRSCPSSPTSFSILKSTLGLSKMRCGVCLHSMRTGQGTAIFTAECSHSFHFPCIVNHIKNQTSILCPICGASWNELPLLDLENKTEQRALLNHLEGQKLKELKTKQSDLKIYNDDEPLMSPTAGGRFNPIPESDYEDEDNEDANYGNDSFQGFFTGAVSTSPITRNIEVRLQPETATISTGRGYETHAVVIEVRAPPLPARLNGKASSFRAPVDLVAVLDVSNTMSDTKMNLMKRAMRVLISSLSTNDRLSIVAFSACSKRLLPLRRMTVDGRRTARRIIDVIATTGNGMSTGDAVRKAVKVLEDRRVKNSEATILVLSNGADQLNKMQINHTRQIFSVQTTRFPHFNIPIHSFGFTDGSACASGPTQSEIDEAFAHSIRRLLSVPVQDLRLQFGSSSVEVKAVYSFQGRSSWLGSGTGLIKMGDFHAEESREILVELRVPVTNRGARFGISVRSSYTDPSSQQMVLCRDQALAIPDQNRAVPMSSSTCLKIERLRCLFISARAVAESRRGAERGDFSGAHHLLSSARALLVQSKSASAGEFLAGMDAELKELNWRRQQGIQWQKSIAAAVEEKEEVLTPTSAWRTAERLAKVARMRKSLNRVSDLHGFENARF